jgi:hypothetical protein
MCFGEGDVDFQCFLRRGLRLGDRLLRRQYAVAAQHNVCIRQSGVSRRVPGIKIDRLAEIFYAFLYSFLGSLVPVIAALQVCLVSFSVLGVSLSQTLSCLSS